MSRCTEASTGGMTRQANSLRAPRDGNAVRVEAVVAAPGWRDRDPLDDRRDDRPPRLEVEVGPAIAGRGDCGWKDGTRLRGECALGVLDPTVNDRPGSEELRSGNELVGVEVARQLGECVF